MKASYRWLKELLPELEASPAQLAERLTRAGLEVEALTEYGAASEHVLVARVVAIEPHPSRPKLQLVTVEVSAGRQQKVVCGAANVPAAGGLVVLAPLGTHLPAKNLTLEPREIGGVVSEGMLCSEAELGLRATGGDAGILVLPSGSASPGQRLSSAVPESRDTVLEIGLTPNRPDCLGHVGLAREIAVLYSPIGGPRPVAASAGVRRAPKPARTSAALDVGSAVTIEIDDLDRCPQYGAALVEGVTVGPSPARVAWRLEALGVRSISNVVDVTNLVMLKYGHPIHGFDLDRVRKATIVVRRAVAGEELVTLDGVKRKLDPDDLVIADGEGPVALAGVMGGEGSEIAPTTRRVLIECAYFKPRGVRRTARRHGMHSESSHRFERGVDPGDVLDVLDESAHLLVELAGGTAAPKEFVAGHSLTPRASIQLRKPTMDALIGVPISMPEATGILERLGCRTSGLSDDEATFIPPTHRPDLEREVDLVEEVIRVRGFDGVPSVIPTIRPAPPRAGGVVTSRLVSAAIEVGLSQALTFGFTSARELERLGAPPAVLTLLNPLSEERSVMRTSLLPGLFEALRRARRHGVSDVRLFTTGARYLAGEASSSGPSLPHEARSFAAVIAGHRDTVLSKPEPVDIYDAKGLVVAICSRATGRLAQIEPLPAEQRPRHLHPRAAAAAFVEGKPVGTFGLLHPETERAFDLGGPALVIELDLEALEALGVRTPRFAPIPTLPASTRDLAVIVHDDIPAGEVERAIRDVAAELCESVEVFDLFRGGSVPKDHRSLAFHVVYRDPKAATDPEHARTLTDVEVDAKHAAVVKAVAERFGAQLRA